MQNDFFRLGLVSVTFRALSPAQIIEKCVEAGLEGIEWGGDIHVPPSDLQTAREVGQRTRDAGLEVVHYGSYYRCDHDAQIPFSAVLDTASELGAPLIRVWAGSVDASDAQTADFARVLADLERISEMALLRGVGIVTEFHGGTLTSTAQSARELLELGEGKWGTLWQPLRRGKNFDPQIQQNLDELELVAPFLGNIHVYEWADDAEGKRQAFSLEKSAGWQAYLKRLRELETPRWLLLEFMPEEGEEVLAREAAALRNLSNS